VVVGFIETMLLVVMEEMDDVGGGSGRDRWSWWWWKRRKKKEGGIKAISHLSSLNKAKGHFWWFLLSHHCLNPISVCHVIATYLITCHISNQMCLGPKLK